MIEVTTTTLHMTIKLNIEYENLDLIKRYAIFSNGALYFLNTDFDLPTDIEVLDNTIFSFYREALAQP